MMPVTAPLAVPACLSAVLLLATVLLAALAAGPAAAEDSKIANKTWVGEITLGGSLATGNTERTAFDAEANAKYRSGRVLDEYKFSGELAKESGSTTAERIKGSYQTNIDIEDGLFALAFLTAEDDRFSGFKYELESGLGVGYRVISTSDLEISVEAAPGYRYSKASAPFATEKEIFARGTAKLNYQMSDNASLNDEVTVSWDDERTKIENTISVSSKII
ncbi:MAG: DUF481 domain-containing protein, partial [Rhodospirillaceae bacterium]|nr:DUF481 domain-containing protein [Rhodospirillaceae bacterium]